MTRRRAFGAVAVAALAVLLGGCAVAVDPAWTPPSWPDAAVALARAPQPLDAAALERTEGGPLTGWRLRNDAVGVQGRVMLFSGASDLDARLLQPLRDAVASRSAAVGVAYTPQVFPRGTGLGDRACARGSTLAPAADVLADAALGPAGGTGAAVVCDVVAASGPFLGQRIRVVAGDGVSAISDTSEIVYADLATGESATAAELWTADAPVALYDALVDALRRDAGSLSLAPVAAPDDAALAAVQAGLATTVPGDGGAFVVTLPAGFTAPELEALGVPADPEAETVALSPAVAASVLTPFGQALAAAAARAQPFAPPTPAPAGSVPVDCALFPCVALTYDDGPGPLTGGILDAYARSGGAATFFAMGEKAAPYGGTLRRMIAEGHLVENHTWNHPHLPTLDTPAVQRQVVDTSRALEAQTGQPITMFRPPYGDITTRVLEAAGLPAVVWDVDTFDWQGPSADTLLARAVDLPRPGSIVLQHDIQPITGQTIDAVLAGVRDRGFTPVTVTQLFGGHPPGPGIWRSAR